MKCVAKGNPLPCFFGLKKTPKIAGYIITPIVSIK